MGNINKLSSTIILARHAQTRFNEAGIIQGCSDSPLTQSGLSTIWKMPELILEYQPGMIFSSSLGRAAFSSSIYSQILGIPVYFRRSLIELSGGELEKTLRSEIEGPRKIVRPSWIDRPRGGESYQDGEKRLREFIHELTSSPGKECKMVLAHAGLNRVLVKMILGLSPQEAISILFPHDTVYVIQNDGIINWFGLSTGSGCGFLREVQ